MRWGRASNRAVIEMFVLVHHEVQEPTQLVDRAPEVFENHPRRLHLAQFVPAKQGSTAFSLWVAPSVEAVRNHLEEGLVGVSIQEYQEVDEKAALGLDAVEPGGKTTAST
jgi:hypothetical protein